MEEISSTVEINTAENPNEDAELSDAAKQAVEDDELSKEIRWYVVHTYSGYENKVKADIERVAHQKGFDDLIVDVSIPVETVTEVKDGKKKIHQRKIYPGYVMVKMHINDETWYLVRNTRGVTGFVGTGNVPVPLTDEEVVKMNIEQLPIEIDIEVGDVVEVLTGAFGGMSGKVTEVDAANNEVTVEIHMFGKITPLKTESYHVKKL